MTPIKIIDSTHNALYRRLCVRRRCTAVELWGRERMADAYEPWIREWINSVADDMMRDHSYMDVNVRGSELVSVSLTEIGATCASLLDENAAHLENN
jgi:hypothetical protein